MIAYRELGIGIDIEMAVRVDQPRENGLPGHVNSCCAPWDGSDGADRHDASIIDDEGSVLEGSPRPVDDPGPSERDHARLGHLRTRSRGQSRSRRKQDGAYGKEAHRAGD